MRKPRTVNYDVSYTDRPGNGVSGSLFTDKTHKEILEQLEKEYPGNTQIRIMEER